MNDTGCVPSPFQPKPAHSLTEDERQLALRRFGSGLLPEDSLVGFDGRYLLIEHLNLDRYVELNPTLNIELVAEGRLHFSVR